MTTANSRGRKHKEQRVSETGNARRKDLHKIDKVQPGLQDPPHYQEISPACTPWHQVSWWTQILGKLVTLLITQW